MLLRIYTVLLISALFAPSVFAAIPLTSTFSTLGGAAAATSSLTASVNAGSSTATATGAVAAAAINIARFNTATGILVGARVNVFGVTTANNAQVSGVVQSGGGGRTIDAVTSMAGMVSGVGFTSITNAPAAASRGCNGGNCNNSPGNAVTASPGAPLAGSATVAANSLAAYAGPGTVTLARSGTGSSKVTTGARASSGTSGAFYTFTGGTYSVSYDYLNFAAPSFAANSVVTSLNIDFGTVVVGSGPVTRTFTLYNIGDLNSAGLSLTGITRVINDVAFTTSVSTFTNLAGGSSLQFSVTFDSSTLGGKLEKFRLSLADFVPQASVGGRDYELELIVSAMSAVPEPQTWAMMIIGFGMVGASARRGRKFNVALSR